ncbi:hypothetical protein RF11_09136 [Thelohanellus kitauei]|uniref:DUF5641 domain-containing protein n=1 Tax=Thelohanellus kitauei TaxID=669202 RepID=A0A0C2MMQ1_THEKT|nr:hypothetical protein RF11_09136 [Thelohanellus kitauei]
MASKFLTKDSDLTINSCEVSKFLQNHDIVWKFIIEYAPWYGGFYERLVKNIKDFLKCLTYHRKMSLEHYQTILVEVESTLNKCPLTYPKGVDKKIGQYVLLKEDLKRDIWKVGKIIKLNISNDNQIRSVNLQFENRKTSNRPISKLVPLELNLPSPSVNELTKTLYRKQTQSHEIQGTSWTNTRETPLPCQILYKVMQTPDQLLSPTIGSVTIGLETNGEIILQLTTANFVNPNSGVHTQNITCLMASKTISPRNATRKDWHLVCHLGDLMYKRKYFTDMPKSLLAFLKNAIALYSLTI